MGNVTQSTTQSQSNRTVIQAGNSCPKTICGIPLLVTTLALVSFKVYESQAELCSDWNKGADLYESKYSEADQEERKAYINHNGNIFEASMANMFLNPRDQSISSYPSCVEKDREHFQFFEKKKEEALKKSIPSYIDFLEKKIVRKDAEHRYLTHMERQPKLCKRNK